MSYDFQLHLASKMKTIKDAIEENDSSRAHKVVATFKTRTKKRRTTITTDEQNISDQAGISEVFRKHLAKAFNGIITTFLIIIQLIGWKLII